MKVVVHVHQGRIRQRLPAIIVKTYRSKVFRRYLRRYTLPKGAVIHQPKKPLGCGARVWIEFDK